MEENLRDNYPLIVHHEYLRSKMVSLWLRVDSAYLLVFAFCVGLIWRRWHGTQLWLGHYMASIGCCVVRQYIVPHDRVLFFPLCIEEKVGG